MTKKKSLLDRFSGLTWNDIEEWAGGRIVDRGRRYQQQGRVSDLASTGEGILIAWVDGTEFYATRVIIREHGLPTSVCTCPYELNCKHGVAVVLEYLKRVENNRIVPSVKQGDNRLELLENRGWDDEPRLDDNSLPEDLRQDIEGFLKGKPKAQLIELIFELAEQHPELTRDLSDRTQLISGNTEALVERLSKEIRHISGEPGWQNYWQDEGFTPDYSGIRKKLETLLKAGHSDEVLSLGRELVETGTLQVSQSQDEGETAMEIATCIPLIVKALDRSSLDPADRLSWALEVVLNDEYEICEAFVDYLDGRHSESAWHSLADELLTRLKGFKSTRGSDDFGHRFARDELSNWAVHALERAGRKAEIIPLCETEASKTGSYARLVELLIQERRYQDAERWIIDGIRDLGERWPGITTDLRGRLQEVRKIEEDWPAVAAIEVEEFVRRPSLQAFTESKKVSSKVGFWPQIRVSLLLYLENGDLPWEQEGWPLPKSGLDQPEAKQNNRFPLIHHLIDIAILEKKPDQILRWYDQRPKSRFGWYGVDEDSIATAIQTHSPDRALAIWKNKAEQLIAQVKPSAYQEAAKYLRKAAKVMSREKRLTEWEHYLKELREEHHRKRRLIEILDGLDDEPIVKKRR